MTSAVGVMMIMMRFHFSLLCRELARLLYIVSGSVCLHNTPIEVDVDGGSW